MPSSIHVVIVMADRGDFSVSKLTGLVREVNQNCVVGEEVLSENVYYYDAGEDAMKLCC